LHDEKIREEPGDISTLANPEAVDKIREALEKKNI